MYMSISGTLFWTIYVNWCFLRQTIHLSNLANSVVSCMTRYGTIRASQKVMPPNLFCWPTKSKADIGGMAVEVKLFHQYSITSSYLVTDGSREAVWQNGIWHGSAYQALVCHWIPLCRNNCIRWCSLTLAEHWWRPKSGCKHSEAVSSAFQWWWQQLCRIYESSIQALVHPWQKCIANGGDYVKK